MKPGGVLSRARIRSIRTLPVSLPANAQRTWGTVPEGGCPWKAPQGTHPL